MKGQVEVEQDNGIDGEVGGRLGSEDGGWLETKGEALVDDMGLWALLGRCEDGGTAGRGKGRREVKVESDEEGYKQTLAGDTVAKGNWVSSNTTLREIYEQPDGTWKQRYPL